MRISTNQVYQHGTNNLQSQQLKILSLEEQLATGFKVNTPADNPISFVQIELMNQRLYTTQMMQINRGMAVSTLNLEESTISSIVNVVQRLREMQVQAGNGAMTSADRASLALEAQNLLDQLQGYANSKDINGNYMFSGGQSNVPAISLVSGEYIFMGDSLKRYQMVSDSLQIPLNGTADDIFMHIPGGNGNFSISQPSTPNAGNAVVNIGAVVNPAAYVPGDYTINFTDDGSGQLMVSASLTAGSPPVTTEVLTPTPYVDGGTINFNGMELIVTGTPQVGDAFFVSTSYESLFSTTQRMIENLNKPYDNAANKAAVQTENNQILAQLDNALDNILNYQSSIGTRLAQLDAAEDLNDSLISATQAVLKQLQEIDPKQAAVEYNAQLVNLQVAQQSFVMIQGLSIFNYL